MKSLPCFSAVVAVLLGTAGLVRADDQTVTYRIIGLSAPERQEDWREAMSKVPEVVVAGVDFDKAEATFRFDVANLYPDGKPPKNLTPEIILTRINDRVR